MTSWSRIAFLEEAAGGPAHLVGYSAGANVALVPALHRPTSPAASS